MRRCTVKKLRRLQRNKWFRLSLDVCKLLLQTAIALLFIFGVCSLLGLLSNITAPIVDGFFDFCMRNYFAVCIVLLIIMAIIGVINWNSCDE